MRAKGVKLGEDGQDARQANRTAQDARNGVGVIVWTLQSLYGLPTGFCAPPFVGFLATVAAIAWRALSLPLAPFPALVTESKFLVCVTSALFTLIADNPTCSAISRCVMPTSETATEGD